MTSNGHLAPAVGETVVLTTTVGYAIGAARDAHWALDAADAEKAVLTPSTDGTSCQVLVRQPGAIRVTVSLGTLAAHALLAATSVPAPGQLVEVPGYHDNAYWFNNVPVVVRSEDEWRRFWQGVLAYSVKYNAGSHLAVPALPAVELSTSSLVVLGTTFGDYHPPAILTRVDPTGEGLVEVALPFEESRVGSAATVYFDLRVYQVPKLPMTTQVVYDCRASYLCGSPEPLPSPAPFAAATAQVLEVSDGAETVQVIDAVVASRELERPFGALQAATVEGPQVFRSAEAWSTFFTRSFYPPGTGADQPWTAPPPPPPAPQVAFPDRNVLAVPVAGRVKPAITAIQGDHVSLTLPGVVRGGHFTPLGAPIGPAAFYDVPALAGTPTVTLEAIPEEVTP